MGSLGATAAFVSAAPLDAETARCSAAACVVQVGFTSSASDARTISRFLPRLAPACPPNTTTTVHGTGRQTRRSELSVRCNRPPVCS